MWVGRQTGGAASVILLYARRGIIGSFIMNESPHMRILRLQSIISIIQSALQSVHEEFGRSRRF
jgi:hypothetical protein